MPMVDGLDYHGSDHGALGVLLCELGRSAGLMMDPLAARRLAADARGATPESEWFQGVELVFRAAGIVLERRSATVGALKPKHLPVFTKTESGGYLLVESIEDGKAVILRVQGEARWYETVPLESLPRLLAVEDRTEVLWLSPRVARPLGSLGDLSTWHKLWALIRLERKALGAVVVYAICVGLLSLATPIAVQSLFTTVAFGTLLQPLVVLAILLASALTFQALLKVFEMVVVEQIQQRIFVRVATDFSQRVSSIRRDTMGGKRLSELMNRFYDVVTVEKALSSIVFDGLSAVLQVGVGMVLLAVYHPILLAFDLGMILVLSFILVVLGRSGIMTAIKESKDKHAVAAWLEEMSDRHVFRSMRGASYGVLRAESLIERWLYHRRKHFRVVLRQSAGMIGMQVGATVLLVLIGGVLVIERQLTLGQLVAAELVMTATVASFAKMGKLYGKFYDLLAGLDKLGQVVGLELEQEAGRPLEREEGEGIEVRYVKPGPSNTPLVIPSKGRLVVDELEPREASELLELVSAWRIPERGRLFFGDVDVHDLALSHVRDQVMTVSKDELFEGSIFDNLSLGVPEVGTSDVWSALERVGLEPAARALSEGLDSRFEQRPFERHNAVLLVLARAWLHRPGLLVLDGVLDPLPEPALRAALAVLTDDRAPWTLVCRTGRPEVRAALAGAQRRTA